MLNYFFNLIKTNKLVQNSAILFTGTMIINVGSYLYHLIAARLLGVVEYGELQSLLSVFIILGVPTATVSLLIVKYAARFKGEDRPDKLFGLLKYFSQYLLIFGLLAFALVALMSGPLSEFLNLGERWPVVVLGAILFINFLSVVNSAILQGTQKFKETSILGIIGVIAKILLTVIFVWLGWSLNGVLGAMWLSLATSYVVSFWFIKFIIKYKTSRFRFIDGQLMSNAWVMFLSLLSLTSLYSVDIILAKHFLSPEIAGEYSGLSILGRIIFFLSGAITTVMFAMSSEVHRQKEGESIKILKQALLIITLISVVVLASYFLLPRLLITVLLGIKFLNIAPYVGWFGLSMFFYSFINVLAQYLLSVERHSFVYFLLGGVVTQTIAIALWHESLWQLIWIMNSVMFGLLVCLLLYLRLSSLYVHKT